MDWNGSTRPFVPLPESSLSIPYNYNYNYHPYPGMEEGKQPAMAETPQVLVPAKDDQYKMNYGNQEKKKRLASNQLDALERNFQEEMKLDPDRKTKLSKDLGLPPRQIAVWFQNRRRRWKTKQLENMYDALKQEFDVISKEKHMLQEEVMKLKGRLREQVIRTQISACGYAEQSGEETVESTSEALRGSNNKAWGTSNYRQQISEGNCSFTLEDYNTIPLLHYASVPLSIYMRGGF